MADTGAAVRLEERVERVEALMAGFRELMDKWVAEDTLAAAPPGKTPVRTRARCVIPQQLCTCTCDDDMCLNCPLMVAARKDTERAAATTGFGLPREKRKFVHVNRPASAPGSEEAEGLGPRRALGCFPTAAGVKAPEGCACGSGAGAACACMR